MIGALAVALAFSWWERSRSAGAAFRYRDPWLACCCCSWRYTGASRCPRHCATRKPAVASIAAVHPGRGRDRAVQGATGGGMVGGDGRSGAEHADHGRRDRVGDANRHPLAALRHHTMDGIFIDIWVPGRLAAAGWLTLPWPLPGGQ